jgi:hypothetical protein
LPSESVVVLCPTAIDVICRKLSDAISDTVT